MAQCFSVRNATCAPTEDLHVRVEMAVTVSCALLATLAIVGCCGRRRTSRSAAFHLLVSLALMLCYPAVCYTVGLVQSDSFRSDLVVVWACFVIGCADGIFACGVDHSGQQARSMLSLATRTQVMYVLLLLLSYITCVELHLQILVLLLCLLNVAKLVMRLLLSAGREHSLAADNWLISEYMGHEHVRSVWDFDPETMKGYKYVVTGEQDVQDGCAGYRLEVTDDLVTVDRVWQHEGSGSSRLKDVCLSFALFKLLRRRLSGNPLHESDDVRTLVFVRRGLAGGDSSDDYERMFRVIEVELGFLFDFFYARYPSPQQSLIPETTIFVAAVALSLSTFFSSALMRYHNPQEGLDILFTRCVIVVFLILELFQYLSAWSMVYLSDWHKVKMLCRCVRQPSWILERLLRLMCRATLTRRYWSNSVGQYSLLHAGLENERSWLARMPLPRWVKAKGLLNRKRTVSRRSLPVTVKRAIHRLVRSEWLSNLKHGDRTLQRNNMLHDFDWSTSRYQHGAVGSILVWHIATAICSAKQSQSQQQAAAAMADGREVATALSNYCAYLLCQAPELVTDQIYGARRLMEALQLRLQQFLVHNACRSEDEMFDKLSGFKFSELEGWYEEAIMADGIKLGNQVLDETPDEAVRWKVLSEMWVELLLSVAPSDNVTAHVKKLATGGELITHLWALLTHGGIIHKPKQPFRRK